MSIHANELAPPGAAVPDVPGGTHGAVILKPSYDPNLVNEDLAPLRKQT